MVSETDDNLRTRHQATELAHLRAAGVSSFHSRCLIEFENKMFQRILDIEQAEGVNCRSLAPVPIAAMTRMSSNITKAIRKYVNACRRMAISYEMGHKESGAMAIMECAIENLESMHHEDWSASQNRSPHQSCTFNPEDVDTHINPIKKAASSVLKDTCCTAGKMTLRFGGGRVVGEILASAAENRQEEGTKTASAIAFDREKKHQAWMRKFGMIRKGVEDLKRPEIDATGMKFMELLINLGDVYHTHGSRCVSVEPSFENASQDLDADMSVAAGDDSLPVRQTPLIWVGGQRVRVKLQREELDRIISKFRERTQTQAVGMTDMGKTVDMSDMVEPRAVIAPVQAATPRSPRTVHREKLREARARALEAIWNDDLPPRHHIGGASVDGDLTSILGTTASTSLLRTRRRPVLGSQSRPASSAGVRDERGQGMAWRSEQNEKGRIWTTTGAQVSAFSSWSSAERFVLRHHAKAHSAMPLYAASARPASGLAANTSTCIRKDTV